MAYEILPTDRIPIERAARKIVEIANSVEPGQDGRIYIELIKGPFLFTAQFVLIRYRRRLSSH